MRHRLSPREREILLWACRGKTYCEIAAILGISFSSTKTYLDGARYKLNAVNLPHACAFAVAVGVLATDEILAGHFELDVVSLPRPDPP
jgi:DNA-binding CsgD family transcriptional regulator